MKFIFTESFYLQNWNSYNARYVKGVSGSHNSPMYLAEALAKKGHEVLFVSITNVMEPIHYKDVKYINFNDLENDTKCDYIVTTNNLNDFCIFNKITKFHKIIMIIHNELYNDNPLNLHKFDCLFQFPPDHYLICFVSEISKKNFLETQGFLSCCKNIILHNSIDMNDLVPYEWDCKMRSFTFFTAYERGLKMVSKILDSFPNFILWTNSYNQNEKQWIKECGHTDQFFITASSSKHLIYSHLAHSRYFVYPLVDLDHKNKNASPYSVNTDTFGYSVLEALLHGVVVLAPRMAVYEELFGDAVCYIDTDDLIPRENLSKWKFACEMLGEPIIQRYVDKINELETNVELRKSFIEKGYALKDKFSSLNICDQLLREL